MQHQNIDLYSSTSEYRSAFLYSCITPATIESQQFFKRVFYLAPASGKPGAIAPVVPP